MARKSFNRNNKNWVGILHEVVNSPAFTFKKGTLAEKLEHFYYYNTGGLQHPAHLLVADFLKVLEELQIEINIKDLKIHVEIKPVYEIAADVAIMSQDIHRILGPIPEIDLTKDTKDVLKEFEQSKLNSIYHPGEILTFSPLWCKSPYLLEAIIYQFEEKVITQEATIRDILPRCLKVASKFHPKKIAIDPMGTEYQTLPAAIFIDTLIESLHILANDLKDLEELILTARSQDHVNRLKKVLLSVLNTKSSQSGGILE